VIVPVFVPAEPDVIVIHDTSAAAVQLQAAVLFTVALKVPPPAGTDCDIGEIAYEHDGVGFVGDELWPQPDVITSSTAPNVYQILIKDLPRHIRGIRASNYAAVAVSQTRPTLQVAASGTLVWVTKEKKDRLNRRLSRQSRWLGRSHGTYLLRSPHHLDVVGNQVRSVRRRAVEGNLGEPRVSTAKQAIRCPPSRRIDRRTSGDKKYGMPVESSD